MPSYPYLAAMVRLTSANNQVRCRIGGVTSVYTLDAGVYWAGMNGTAGSPTDATLVTALESLLTEFNQKTTIEVIFDTATGHVTAGNGGVADSIFWGHADTTIDPRWFGQAPTAGVYATTTFAGTPTLSETISQIGSSLIYPSFSRTARGDLAGGRVRRNIRRADSGKTYRTYYGKTNRRILEFRLDGIPREDGDSSIHAFRRFMDSLATGNAGEQFYFFPDPIVASNPAPWGPDDANANRRYGYQRLILAPEQPLDFEPAPLFEGYYNQWPVQLVCEEYVA